MNNANDNIQKELSSPETPLYPLSTVNPNEFYNIIQQQYGGMWGKFKFEDSRGDYSGEGRSFLYIDGNIDLTILSQFMANEWKLQAPNLVISILSATSRYRLSKNITMVEALKTGIRNTVNATEIWFITNGLELGMSQLIGSAFRDEISFRQTDDAWAIQMGRDPKKRKKLILIGIVCDDEIKDFIDFKGAQEEPKQDVKVAMRKRDQMSLNADHTHFIIIREQPIDFKSINDSAKNNAIIDNDVKQLEKLTDSADSATNKFRDRFENFLYQEKSTSPVESSQPITTDTAAVTSIKSNPWGDDGFPMVCILVRGKPGTIECAYRKIQNEVPIIVLKGTGLAADIISFAYEEICAKMEKEHNDNQFKADLARRILEDYPLLRSNDVKRNEIRNFIMSIASIVQKNEQKNRKFLTFININKATESLNDFHKFILLALLQSQKPITGNKVLAQLKRNLLLTLDWNTPDLASSEIFQRDDSIQYSIQPDLFDKAILGKKLEAFVDLFLNQNFVLHRYLKSDRLISLFNNAKDKEFFKTTSIDGILGQRGDDGELKKAFFEKCLNNVVKHLTGINHFFNEHEMDCNAFGIYFGDKSENDAQRQRMRAERKALRYLVIYAVLMNRHQLAKILWKRSFEPIPLALICDMMYTKLVPYCPEVYQRTLIEKQAKEFSDCALGVLDKAFNEDSTRTFEMLDAKHPDWSHMATIELAYNADNKDFVAHAACQKWVTRQFYGEITPRELSWGLFRCPDSIKIISSAILIFPMWFWINFSPIGQAPSKLKTLSDLPPDAKKGSEPVPNIDKGKQLAEHVGEVNIREGSGFFQRIRRCFRGNNSGTQKTTSDVPKSDEKNLDLFEKIYVLWSAPITKFYTNFVAYLTFLFLFTLAVMWPSCGNLLLDCVVWFWATSITFENTRVSYEKYCSQSNLPLGQAVFEIIVQIVFLALYLSVRIIGLWSFGTCHIVPAKAILGFGLIYYYYRILFTVLPISPTLGPMMIRLQRMVVNDFLTFLQLFAIFMISSSVAITSTLFPHHPLNLDLFAKTFVFRGLMALFSTDMSDLKREHYSCSINRTDPIEKENICLRLSHGLSYNYDNIYAYQRYGIESPKCNQPSWIAWVFLIQYFFLCKLFLTSLLTAMFRLTGATVQKQSEQIWMYNRYAIVMEYAKRPRLPPPFVFISYIGMLITSCSRHCILKVKEYSDKKSSAAHRIRTQSSTTTTDNHDEYTHDSIDPSAEIIQDRSLIGRCLNCKPCKTVTENQKKKSNMTNHNTQDSQANLYWKYKAKEFFDKTQEADKVQVDLDNLSNCVTNIEKDMNVQRISFRQINDRIGSLDRLMIDRHILIEKIRSKIQQDKSLPELNKFAHILSRESPYIYTYEPRFPVTERYIPWKVQFYLYDPTIISLPKEHVCFKDSERPFVEPDLLKPTSDDDHASLTDDYEDELPVNGDTNATSSVPLTQPDVYEAVETSVTDDIIIPFTDFKWNQIVEMQLSNGNKIIIDRTTWITSSEDDTPPAYQLDAQLSIPLNPMGRTGVCGRGALIRWGPNKSIMAAITRWKRHNDEIAIIDGQRILEALVFKHKSTNDWRLLGGKILGVASPYSAICHNFNKLAFKDYNSEQSLSVEEKDMIEYFQSFARRSFSTAEPTEFTSCVVYRGYIDDLRNTDNAWAEAEIWNFHYDSDISLPNLRTDGVALWKDVTNKSQSILIQTAILREIARIHNAYFE
ncbi:unnamed protein product [Rotaria sordida]|uniref:TRPM SLOG domain-containing protein n=1 Tax=Rotaria sordida TaxID=392033 RepID=A0A814XNV4_9BILA|nr:unnamed protein product [Rotaria sordida]CAF1495715.1 unnamed protein product [Rotaria sordida]